LNVAHLVPPGLHPYSGVLTSVVHLGIAQARRGQGVEFWHFGRWPLEGTELDGQITGSGVERIAVAPKSLVWLRPATARVIAMRPVDVVHLHGVFNPFNNQVAHRLPFPYVVSPHGGYAPEALAYHALRKRVFRRLFELRMLRRARVICALTASEAAEVRRFGVSGRVAVVPNGVSVPEVPCAGQSVRDAMGWLPTDRIAMYVGRLDVRAKRLDHLVRAIAQVPGWRLAIVGGDFREGARTLLRLIEQLNVGDRVRLTGPKRNGALHTALSSADLFVLLSRSEGLPMALLEAAAHGVPSLVSPEVERSTGVGAANGGWCTEVNAVTAALRRIAGLEQSEFDERRRGAAAFARRHDWSVIATEYEAIYTSVLADTSPGPTVFGGKFPGYSRS